MLEVAVGHSEDIHSADAIAEVLDQCRSQLDDAPAQAGLLFAAIDHEFDIILAAIDQAYPGIELVEFKTGLADQVSQNPTSAIREAVETVRAVLAQDLRLCITTPSSLTVSGSVVVDSLLQGLGEACPIFGALAGDQLRLEGQLSRQGTGCGHLLLLCGSQADARHPHPGGDTDGG